MEIKIIYLERLYLGLQGVCFNYFNFLFYSNICFFHKTVIVRGKENFTMTSFLFRLLLNLKGQKGSFKNYIRDFPGGTMGKNLPAWAGDTGSIPDRGRSHVPWSG